jgi:anthranilate phosphoribosyltransferase
MDVLTQPDLAAPLAGGLLAALRSKGVTSTELQGLATRMQGLALRPQIPSGLRAVDIVGTGGDHSGSLNLSTGAALLTAACGVPVIKHGNRSISSRSGSADVLQQLGLKLPLAERAAGECLAMTGFTFLFAPHYHPAMKSLAPIRAALGVRTVFNVLGPLCNPAAPPFMVLGAFDRATAELMAGAMLGMAIERAFVVHSDNGWDEPTPIAPFTLFDVQAGKISTSRRSAVDYGLPGCSAADLAGADAAYNAAALARVLRNEERGAHRSALLLGAALALEVTGTERSPSQACARAALTLDSGAAGATLARLAQFGGAL